MIKNVKKFLKESEANHKNFLKSLNLKNSIKILENLLTSKLLGALTFRHKDTPLSIEKALKHAKLAR
jgi:hypothetical protein